MIRKQEITGYKYEFRSSEPENIAVLYLQSKEKVICMGVFTSEEYIPPPREGMNGIIYLAYRCDWLKGLIDMLRHESPVYFYWDEELKISRITTENDIVDEEVHKSLFRYVFGDSYDKDIE